ncbi:magnesium/cobalt transporter CorA [bacterium]|nr:magnesium/cobalt transporter CorA [bacterium]
MLRCFYLHSESAGSSIVRISTDMEEVLSKRPEDILWIDLLNGSAEERQFVEQKFETELFTRQEAEEIESSSKYSEVPGEININSNFLVKTSEGYRNEPVSFILHGPLLITQRNVELKSFDDGMRRIVQQGSEMTSNFAIFLWLFETRIDFDADFLESIAREIAEISRELAIERNLDEALLIRINHFQEVTMLIRENIVDKQRIISSILKSTHFPKEEYAKLRVMIKDVGSLLDHTQFNFERLEYLQNTFLGLLDIEQSKITKIFTVVTVVFMPPTLIASIYGMNFRLMPELVQSWGYPFALLLMALSSGLTLFYFKRNNWL